MPNRKNKKNKQKGGYSYGFTKSGLIIPNTRFPITSSKSCGAQRGGGLVGSPIKGNFTARPEFLKPGFGFSNPQFISTPPNLSSYESGGCPKVGGKRKRTRNKRNKRKKKKKKKTRRRRKTKKRNNKKKTRRRRTKKRKLIGCGQKGGHSILLDDTAPNITSFPGKLDVSMAIPNSLPNVKTIGNSGYFNGHQNTYKHVGH